MVDNLKLTREKLSYFYTKSYFFILFLFIFNYFILLKYT